MAEVSPFAEFLGQAIYHFTAAKPLLPMYGHLIISALFPIYAGAHASLSKPSSAAEPPKKDQNEEGYESDNDEDEDEEQGNGRKMEALEPSDAVMFPLTAGLTLGGLYLVINYMGAELLNKILGFYFSQMGILFAVAFLKDSLTVLRSYMFPRRYRHAGKVWKSKQADQVFTSSDPGAQSVRHSPFPGIFGSIPLPKPVLVALWRYRGVVYQRAKLRINIHRLLKVETPVGVLDLISVLIALPVIYYFTFILKPWWLTNFLGFGFCYGTLQILSPSTFVTGSLILSALFFYDIYFVFYTPLMVTVAKNLDVPIKLLFPRPTDPSAPEDTMSLAMLGLGDIIIPGIMVGLALRFDLFLYYKRKGIQKAQAEGKSQEQSKPLYQSATGGWGERFWSGVVVPGKPELDPPYHDARSFPKPYFKASIAGYVLGMLATLIVMQCFNHPQPALLYLVPGVLLSLWGTALVRGELREMWDFSDAEEEEDSGEEKKEDQDDATKNGGFFGFLFGQKKSAEKKEEENEKTAEEESKNEDGKTSEDKKGDQKEDDSKPLDLFSVSVYIPRKKKSKAEENTQKESKSTDDEENWSFVGKSDKGDEPPAKRLRRSPRTAAATTN
ncbi:signal peptide peptidase-domain-containing protein [Aspergillus floccosus]